MEALLTNAESYFARGQFDQALSQFTEAFTYLPPHHDALLLAKYNHCTLPISSNEATKHHEFVQELVPEVCERLALLYRRRSECCLHLGNYRQALKDAEHSLLLQTDDNMAAHLLCARALQYREKYSEALSHLKSISTPAESPLSSSSSSEPDNLARKRVFKNMLALKRQLEKLHRADSIEASREVKVNSHLQGQHNTDKGIYICVCMYSRINLIIALVTLSHPISHNTFMRIYI